MTKGRVEASSDGVFAVIITIMVLKLKLRWDRADPICHGMSGPSTTGPAAQQHQHPKRLIVSLILTPALRSSPAPRSASKFSKCATACNPTEVRF
jgi:hypothetical protein